MSRITYIENMEKWKTGFYFKNEVKVRFSETDMFGHLNNTVPFIYFEEARIEYLKKIGFMQAWVSPDSEKIPVVADLQCDFVKQVFFDEKLSIYVKVERIGKSSVDVHYLGENEKKEVCFTGRGTMVQISKKTGKGHPWSEEEINIMTDKIEINTTL
jgi:acyl-CoA thioester hydrolase